MRAKAATMTNYGLRWERIHWEKGRSRWEGFGKEHSPFTAPVNRLQRGRPGSVCPWAGAGLCRGEAERRRGGEALDQGGRSNSSSLEEGLKCERAGPCSCG